MDKIVLRDRNYQIIGYIETESSGRKILRDARYQIAGYYEPQQNVTRDRNYSIVGYGDLLLTLLNK